MVKTKRKGDGTMNDAIEKIIIQLKILSKIGGMPKNIITNIVGLITSQKNCVASQKIRIKQLEEQLKIADKIIGGLVSKYSNDGHYDSDFEKLINDIEEEYDPVKEAEKIIRRKDNGEN